MEKNIAVIWGDCSSPEIVKQTIRVQPRPGGPKSTARTFPPTPTPPWAVEAIDKYGGLPRQGWTSAWPPTACCWVPWAAPNGRVCPGSSARKRACCACAPAWACTPTTARPRSGPSWPASPKPEIVAQGHRLHHRARELIGGDVTSRQSRTPHAGKRRSRPKSSMPYQARDQAASGASA